MNVALVVLITASMVMGACAPQATPQTTAYSSPATKQPTTEEIRGQARAWADCVFQKIVELDDGRSDASTIARAVRGNCHQLYRGTSQGESELIIEAVLMARSKGVSGTGAKKTPALSVQTVGPAWTNCASAALRGREIATGSVAAHAVAVADICRGQYQGPAGQDVPIIASAIEKIRSEGMKAGGIVVGPNKSMPPADVRM